MQREELDSELRQLKSLAAEQELFRDDLVEQLLLGGEGLELSQFAVELFVLHRRRASTRARPQQRRPKPACLHARLCC